MQYVHVKHPEPNVENVMVPYVTVYFLRRKNVHRMLKVHFVFVVQLRG